VYDHQPAEENIGFPYTQAILQNWEIEFLDSVPSPMTLVMLKSIGIDDDKQFSKNGF
jgi:hypothetical protein